MNCCTLQEKAETPLVSIIIPVFKVEAYLDRCVTSVVQQTYQNIEVILVDDGSPDCCPQICDKWANKDNRIRVVHKHNEGVAKARNNGIDIAQGDYLMFVDSDDWLLPNAVGSMVDRLQSDGSDFVIAKHIDVYENNSINDRYCRAMKSELLSDNELLQKMGTENVSVAPWGKLFRAGIIEHNIFPPLFCGEDMCAFVSYVQKSRLISLMSETVYCYFQRENSVIHRKSESAKIDEIKANLFLAYFMLSRDQLTSARKWLIRVINFGMNVSDTKTTRLLINDTFNCQQRMKLFWLLDMRNRIKWLLLYMPCIYRKIKRG